MGSLGLLPADVFSWFYTVHEYKNLEIELLVYHGLPLNYYTLSHTISCKYIHKIQENLFFGGVEIKVSLFLTISQIWSI